MLNEILSTALNGKSVPGESTNSRNGTAGSGLGLEQLLTGTNGLATGAAAGGLAALLLGGAKPKKLAKNALKVGGVALVGGLAYKAWNDWQANKTQSAAPVAGPVSEEFIPQEPSERRLLARSLARAMIAAAKADGHVTERERERILAQLQVIDIDQADHQFIREELAGPADMDAIVRDATTPERAAELYTASLLAVDRDGPAEQAYLAFLAARLRLDANLVAHIHANTNDLAITAAA